MKKRLFTHRFVALLCCLCMLFTASVFAFDDAKLDAAITQLAEMPAQKRQTLFDFLAPLLIIDEGLDTIVDMVENPGSPDSLAGQVSQMLLSYVDKETVLEAVETLREIDESTREKFVDIYDYKTEFSLSGEGKGNMAYFMQKAFDRYQSLEKLLTEEQITPGVAANLLTVLTDINDGQALFTTAYGDETAWKTGRLSAFWKEHADFVEQMLSNIAGLEAGERQRAKSLFLELGLYKAPKRPAANTPGGSFNVVTDQNENQLPQIEGAAVIEVGEVPGEGSYVLEIPNQQESAMLFQIADGGALLPVKSCVWKNGSLYAKLTQNGYYAIKNMPANFTDVSGWGAFYVESLYQRGIISGRSEKIFAPNDAVLREEFVKLVVELFGGVQSGDAASFSDVSEDDWFYPYVATAYQKGYISGIDKSTFGVGMQITRQDMCKIIENVLQKNGVAPALEAAKFSDDEAIAGYAKNAVDLLFELDIVSGDDQGAFHPQNSATRQEAAKIIFGVLSFQIFNL